MASNPFDNTAYPMGVPPHTEPIYVERDRIAVWVLVCVVAMLAGGTAWLAGRYLSDQTAPPRTVSVMGMTQDLVKADQATLQVTLVARGDTLKKAYEKLEGQKLKFTQHVSNAANGLVQPRFDAPVVTTIANTKPDMDASDAVAVYVVKVCATASLTDALVMQASKVHDSLKSLVDDGLEIMESNVFYQMSSTGKNREAMVSRAVTNALSKAEAIAKAGGARLGELHHVEHGFFQITALGSAENNLDGRVDAQGLDKVLKLGLKVTFTLR